ncbi:MAG: prepilin-type N-terminal cleavage/methylation domain-containing protein [Elusimicrobiaceae bacterium]|nr:prepilin-type N-terminal cleavage/methylation domain-containing protein [Elusimicrobiaceae bacterium]
MKNTNGFTLLELLIAAMLVAVLAMFATLAFRQTSSDIRLQDAKNRADNIAMAVQRFVMEYEGGVLENLQHDGNVELTNPTSATLGACNSANPFLPVVGGKSSLQNLVNCGLLEYRAYLDGNFSFKYNYVGSGFEICVCGTSGKLSSKYKCSEGYNYCTDGENHTEQFGS